MFEFEGPMRSDVNRAQVYLITETASPPHAGARHHAKSERERKRESTQKRQVTNGRGAVLLMMGLISNHSRWSVRHLGSAYAYNSHADLTMHPKVN